MLGKFWLYAYAYGMCIKPFSKLPLVLKSQFKILLHIWLFLCSQAETNSDQISLHLQPCKEREDGFQNEDPNIDVLM